MARIDEIKEILNTLRIIMSIAFGVLVVVVGSLIKRYDSGNIDGIFWVGVVFALATIFFILIVVKKIAQKTKEIKDL